MRTRQKFTGEFKSRVVLEILSGEKPVAEVCRVYEVTAQMVNDWKAQFLAAAPQVFENSTPSSGEAERITELEQMVGKLTMQLEIANVPGGGHLHDDLTALLGWQGWSVNHKRIQRLMRQMGLQRPVKKRKIRTTNSDHPFPRYPNLVQLSENK